MSDDTNPLNIDTPDSERIREGRRVECRKGTFSGQKGRVLETWGEHAIVELRSCTIIEKRAAFTPVTYE